MNSNGLSFGAAPAAEGQTENDLSKFHVKETPIPSTRRNRLAMEMRSSRRPLGSDLYASEKKMLPPSTVIRNRFKDFLNGPARVNSTISKKRRVFEDDESYTPEIIRKDDPKITFNLPNGLSLQASNAKGLRTNNFFSKLNNIYETPSQTRTLDKNRDAPPSVVGVIKDIFSPNLENEALGQKQETNHLVEREKEKEKEKEKVSISQNSDFSKNLLYTPNNLRTPESASEISSIARPGSAVRKMLDEALRESQRLSEVEKSKQEADKAIYEQKKLSFELNRCKIEMERLKAEHQSKIATQEKKLERLEKERGYLYNKEENTSKLLKNTDKELRDSKSYFNQIINKLKTQLDDEEAFRSEQEQISNNTVTRLKSQVSNFESRIVKLENYRKLMDQQMISVIKESGSDISAEELENYDWQKSIASIKTILLGKNTQIFELKKSVSEFERLLELGADYAFEGGQSTHVNNENKDDTSTNAISNSIQTNSIVRDPFNSLENDSAKTQETNEDIRMNQSTTLLDNVKQKSFLKVKNLQNQVASLDRIIATNIAEINKNKSENAKLIGSIELLQSQIRDYNIIKEQNTELTSRLSDLETLKNNLASLEADYELLSQERDKWNDILYTEDSDQHESSNLTPSNKVANLVSKQRGDIKLSNMRLKDLEYENKSLLARLQDHEKLKAKYEVEIQELNTKLNSTSYKLVRIEKSNSIAFREIEFLRAQLNSYDMEETNLMEGNYDTAKSERIIHLEKLLESQREYINELEQLLHQAIQKDSDKNNPGVSHVKEDLNVAEEKSSSAMITQLLENNKQLEEKYDTSLENIKRYQELNERLDQEKSSLQTKFEELERQLAKLEYMVGAGDYNPLTTRILQLADNPSSKDYAIRKTELNKLKEENGALLSQLQRLLKMTKSANSSSIPITSNEEGGDKENDDINNYSESNSALFLTIENLKSDNQKLVSKLNDSKKAIKRLKEVWRAKASELREAVYSLLGYRVDFLENGRVRLTSMYTTSPNNSFIFGSSAGDKGTIELIGGGNKTYIQSLQADIRYWVSERGSIPAFLATTTLQLFENT